MAGEFVVSVVAHDGAVADRAIEPRFSAADSPLQLRSDIDQMVVKNHKLAFKVGGVGGDVALAIADYELLITSQAAKPDQHNYHRDQGNHCDCSGDYGDQTSVAVE